MRSGILASQVVREGGSQGGFELGVWDTEERQVVRVRPMPFGALQSH